MKVVLLVNNLVGWKLTEWLRTQPGTKIVGLVIHEPQKQKYAGEIQETAGLPDERIFNGAELGEPEVCDALQELQPDMGISLFFDYILTKKFLDLFPKGCINVHPAYLPYGKGSYPNIFSIIEGTPAGATVHYIDETIDTGDVIARKEVPVEMTDTGATLYRKLEQTCIDLFKETWPTIVAGTAERTPQRTLGNGTVHRYKDVEPYDAIDLEKKYKANDLVNIIRARTFAPHSGAYITDENGEKVYLRLQLLREDELSNPPQ